MIWDYTKFVWSLYRESTEEDFWEVWMHDDSHVCSVLVDAFLWSAPEMKVVGPEGTVCDLVDVDGWAEVEVDCCELLAGGDEEGVLLQWTGVLDHGGLGRIEGRSEGGPRRDDDQRRQET